MENNITKIKKNVNDMIGEINKKYSKYNTIIVDKDNIKDMKKVRADINKTNSEIDTERKNIKKEILKPYDEIEVEFKKITTYISDISSNLNKSILAVEKMLEDEKMEEIEKLIDMIIDEPKISNNLIIKKKWLNKGTSIKAITEELHELKQKIENDLRAIEKEEYDLYFESLDLTKIFEARKLIASIANAKAKIETENVVKSTNEKPNNILHVIYNSEEQKQSIIQFVKDIGADIV